MESHRSDLQNNKQRILDAAAALFADRGYDGVSVREIAERAEVTKPVIYYYFKNKRDLHETLIRQAFSHAHQIHEDIFHSETSMKQKLRMLMRAHFNFCKENPDVIKILFDAIHQRIDEKQFMKTPEEMEKNPENIRRISDFIRLGQQQQIFKDTINPMKVGMLFVGAMNIFILYQLHTDKEVLSDEVADELVDIILNGILLNSHNEQHIQDTEETGNS